MGLRILLAASASMEPRPDPFQLMGNEESSLNHWLPWVGGEVTEDPTNGCSDCSDVLTESTTLQSAH